ncbi:PEP-CTERM sorting domain-containing protein [Roseateles sp. P5_D6]
MKTFPAFWGSAQQAPTSRSLQCSSLASWLGRFHFELHLGECPEFEQPTQWVLDVFGFKSIGVRTMSQLQMFRTRSTLSPGATWIFNAVICLAAMGPAISASASEVKVTVFANYTAEDGSNGGVGPVTHSSVNGSVSEKISSVWSGSGGSSGATADYGVLKSSAIASASRGNIFNGFASVGKAYAAAHWSDSVTVAGAGLSGTGWANIRFFVDPASGSLLNSGTAGLGGSFAGTAAADFVFSAGGATVFSFNVQAALTHLGTDPTYTFTRVNGLDYTGDLRGFWELSIPVTFGQAFALDAGIDTTAYTLAGSNSSVDSFANFGNSIYWAGITSITLANGSTTTAFSALGNTAHDWKVSAVPVPEPSSGWLLCFGLGTLAVFLAFRKKVVQPHSPNPNAVGLESLT